MLKILPSQHVSSVCIIYGTKLFFEVMKHFRLKGRVAFHKNRIKVIKESEIFVIVAIDN